MIAMLPLEGWILSNAHGVSVSLLGVVPLPRLIDSDSELADVLSDYHVWLAWVLLAVVVVHALAALWHHFVLRDGVLRAMCPRWLIR
jgi:cytochrome b561